MTEVHALAGFDRSPEARRAVELAADLLAPARLTVATGWRPAAALDAMLGAPVLARVVPAYRDLDEIARELAGETAEEGAAVARARGVAADTLVFRAGDVAVDLLQAAREAGADVLVLGGRERAARHPTLLGSVATAVLQRADRPVLVERGADPDPAGDGPHLLAYDGSPGARAAIAAAGRLLRRRRALVVHVWLAPSQALRWNPFLDRDERDGPGAELDRTGAEGAARLAEEGAELARAAGFAAEPLTAELGRAVWRTLVDVADERGAASIVVGSHGRSRPAALLGDVAEGVARHAGIPALVVPVGDEDGDGAAGRG